MDKIPSDKFTDDNRVPFIVYEGTIATMPKGGMAWKLKKKKEWL